MNGTYSAYIAVELFSALIDLILIVTCLAEKKFNDSAYNYLLWCMIVCFVGTVTDIPTWTMAGDSQMVSQTYALFSLGYVCSEAAMLLFTFYLVFTIRKVTYISTVAVTFASVIVAANLAIWFWGIRGGVFVYIADGAVCYSEYYWVTRFIPLIVLLYDALLVLSCRKSLNRMELFAWLSFCVCPLLALTMQELLESSAMAMGTSVSLVLLYISIHSQQNVKLAEQEVELSDARVQIMLSQMQPHLMYNSLNSIYYLIEKDPARAQKAVSTFSDYLRANINSLRSTKPLLFDSELTHIKSYLELEKMRFGSSLNIIYDIKVREFSLPPLSVQPIVENAVKHGISQKRGGGTVKLETYDDETYNYIKVTDDGVGFEPGQLSPDGNHIGLENIKERIERMSHGHMEIMSKPGEGTTVTVKLPKKYS